MTFAGRSPSDPELESYYRDYGHAWHDSPITRIRYRELLATFEPYRHTNRLLDIGCGAGYFLDEARAQGWQVWGTEYGERALRLARERGLDVIKAPLEADTFKTASFDVVTAFEVFEHVRDLMQAAAVVAQVLRRGGLLYCTTPNFNSLSRRVLGPRWSVVEYPEHLWYFTPKTIRSWLEPFGFDTEAITSSGVSPSRFQSSIRDRSRSGDGVPDRTPACAFSPGDDERLRKVIERSHLLHLAKAGTNRGLSALGAGDALKGRFKRC